ncbi:MAG: sigma-70 family RNA polymerase sigma factor [Pirellulales bacterium]
MDELLEQYVPRVYRFALRLTNDRHQAEDLTQETFLRAWRQRGRLRDEQSALAWLFRIAANLWRDQARRGRLAVGRAGRLDEDVSTNRAGPVAEAADREMLQRALAAMDSLPPRQREVLYLVAVEKLDVDEVAGIVQTSREAVRASLCIARRRMRELLSMFCLTIW